MAGRTAAKAEFSGVKSATGARAGHEHRGGDKLLSVGVLDGHLGYFLRRVQVWVFQDFIRTLASIDLRPAQYSVLAVIGANRGLSQADVAQLLGIERARLVHLLDSLEQRKLVKRIKSKTDRRSHALHLTTQGETALAKFKRLAAEHERHVEARIGKANRERLLQILAGFT